jgi:hypothetical protein
MGRTQEAAPCIMTQPTFCCRFKLEISITGSTKIFSSKCMHFDGTCPSIICTHHILDVTDPLGQVWVKIVWQKNTTITR